MKTKLKMRLVTLEKAICVQILEQDERFKPGDNFTARTGMAISNFDGPELYNNEFYLRGKYKNYDLKPSIMGFKTNEDRDEYIKKLITALQDWSDNFPGFKEPEEVDIDRMVKEVLGGNDSEIDFI